MTVTNQTTPAQLQLDEGQSTHNDRKDNIMTISADTANDPTPPACPSWCTDEPGHPYDSMSHDGAELDRFHSGRDYLVRLDDHTEPQPNGNQARTAISVQITALEANFGGATTLARPMINLYDTEDLTVRDCRRLINALILADAELSEITGEVPLLQTAFITNVSEWLKGVGQ